MTTRNQPDRQPAEYRHGVEMPVSDSYYGVRLVFLAVALVGVALVGWWVSSLHLLAVPLVLAIAVPTWVMVGRVIVVTYLARAQRRRRQG